MSALDFDTRTDHVVITAEIDLTCQCGRTCRRLINRRGETRCEPCDEDFLERLDIAEAESFGGSLIH